MPHEYRVQKTKSIPMKPMKIFAPVLVLASLMTGAGGHAVAQTPEQACRPIMDRSCYGAVECNKQKRAYAKCVQEKAQEMGAQKGNKPLDPQKAPKGKR